MTGGAGAGAHQLPEENCCRVSRSGSLERRITGAGDTGSNKVMEAMMRFLMFIKHPERTELGEPPSALYAAIDNFIEETTKDGTLLDTGGLLPIAEGAEVRLADGKVTVVDGPFTEAKEVIGGWAMFQLHSKEEAVELAVRFMDLHAEHWPAFNGVSEVRQIAEPPTDE